MRIVSAGLGYPAGRGGSCRVTTARVAPGDCGSRIAAGLDDLDVGQGAVALDGEPQDGGARPRPAGSSSSGCAHHLHQIVRTAEIPDVELAGPPPPPPDESAEATPRAPVSAKMFPGHLSAPRGRRSARFGRRLLEPRSTRGTASDVRSGRHGHGRVPRPPAAPGVRAVLRAAPRPDGSALPPCASCRRSSARGSRCSGDRHHRRADIRRRSASGRREDDEGEQAGVNERTRRASAGRRASGSIARGAPRLTASTSPFARPLRHAHPLHAGRFQAIEHVHQFLKLTRRRRRAGTLPSRSGAHALPHALGEHSRNPLVVDRDAAGPCR